jgi:zinc transporter ZupT
MRARFAMGGVACRERISCTEHMFAILLTSVSAISTFGGGLAAVWFRRRVHLLLGFGAGALLGATFFDLMPEAIQAATRRGWSLQSELALVVIGFVFFHVAERFIEFHMCPDCDTEQELRRHVGRFSALGLIGHSMLDGASIATATLVSWRVGLVVAIGIIAHDISDGLNTMLLVTHGEQVQKNDFLYLVADAIAPLLGGLIIVVLKLSPQGLAILLGITSGFFLFTATGDLLPEAHRRSPGWAVTVTMLIGIAFIYVAVKLVGAAV